VERAGLCPDGLAPLDDAAERAANAVMAGRMKRGEA
jgi:hypothetical protein